MSTAGGSVCEDPAVDGVDEEGVGGEDAEDAFAETEEDIDDHVEDADEASECVIHDQAEKALLLGTL